MSNVASIMSNVASTLLLVWTGLIAGICVIEYDEIMCSRRAEMHKLQNLWDKTRSMSLCSKMDNCHNIDSGSCTHFTRFSYECMAAMTGAAISTHFSPMTVLASSMESDLPGHV